MSPKRRRLVDPLFACRGVLQPTFALTSSAVKRCFSSTGGEDNGGESTSCRRKIGDKSVAKSRCSTSVHHVRRIAVQPLEEVGELADKTLSLVFRCAALGALIGICLATPACPLSFCLPFGGLCGSALGLFVACIWYDGLWCSGFVYHHLLHADLPLYADQVGCLPQDMGMWGCS